MVRLSWLFIFSNNRHEKNLFILILRKTPLLEPQVETKEQLKKKLNLFTEILPMEKKTKKFQNII
jgi:hypothetical protein